MLIRVAGASAALLLPGATAAAAFVISDVDVCPPASYAGIAVANVGNPGLGSAHGPTPRGSDGKCGITEMRAAAGACPVGVLSHYAHDIVDLWSDPNPPVNRVFRESLHINSFDGIPVGGRLKFAEVVFGHGERVSFHFDRAYSWYTDFVVTHLACEFGCAEQEVGRFEFPMGLTASGPGAEAVPITISWSTGRHPQVGRNVSWTLSTAVPDRPIHMGWVELAPWAREARFDHGIVNASCDGSDATRIRFVKPRFDPY